VIESTYGDRNHPDRRTRRALLKAVVEKALADQGVVLIPAFSIGRTQEILYELEAIIAQEKRRAAARAAVDAKAQANGKDAGKPAHKGSKRRGLDWTELGIIVDSPLASRF